MLPLGFGRIPASSSLFAFSAMVMGGPSTDFDLWTQWMESDHSFWPKLPAFSMRGRFRLLKKKKAQRTEEAAVTEAAAAAGRAPTNGTAPSTPSAAGRGGDEDADNSMHK